MSFSISVYTHLYIHYHWLRYSAVSASERAHSAFMFHLWFRFAVSLTVVPLSSPCLSPSLASVGEA